MNFELTMEDFTIIQNALHYYKKVDKKGNFQQYNKERINNLRDTLSHQIFNSEDSNPDAWSFESHTYNCLSVIQCKPLGA